MTGQSSAGGMQEEGAPQNQAHLQGYPEGGAAPPGGTGGSSFDWTWVVVVALLIVLGLLGAVWLYNYGQAQQAEAYNEALSQSAQQVEDSTSALEQAITDLREAIEGIGPDSAATPSGPETPEGSTETQGDATGESTEGTP